MGSQDGDIIATDAALIPGRWAHRGDEPAAPMFARQLEEQQHFATSSKKWSHPVSHEPMTPQQHVDAAESHHHMVPRQIRAWPAS